MIPQGPRSAISHSRLSIEAPQVVQNSHDSRSVYQYLVVVVDGVWRPWPSCMCCAARGLLGDGETPCAESKMALSYQKSLASLSARNHVSMSAKLLLMWRGHQHSGTSARAHPRRAGQQRRHLGVRRRR